MAQQQLKLPGQIIHMLPPMIGQICLLTHLLLPKRPFLNWNDTNFPTVKFDIHQPAEHLACVFGAIAVLIEERSSQATTSPRLPTVSDGIPTGHTAQSHTARQRLGLCLAPVGYMREERRRKLS